MKAVKLGLLVGVMAITANALPGLYRYSSGNGGHHLTGTHVKVNDGGKSANVTVVSVEPATPSKDVAARAIIDLGLSAAADLSVSTDGSTTFVQVDEAAGASISGVNVVESADGFIGLGAVVDSTQDSVNHVVDSTQGSVNNIVDSTQGSVNMVADSTQGSVGIDSIQDSVNKVADSTRGAINVVGSTQVVNKRVPVFTVGPDSKLRPHNTNLHSVTLKSIIPTPTVIPRGVFPRGQSGVYGSSNIGLKTFTVTSETSAASTTGISVVAHPSTSGIKAVAPGSVLPSSGSTEVVITHPPASTPGVSSTQGSLTMESTEATTSTITQSTTRTVTQLIALNPSYKEPSMAVSTDGPCTAATTVTVTVVATNIVASPSLIMAKYVNVTMSTVTSVGSSTFTTSAIGPCKLTSLPGFVGLQLPSGSQVGGASCTASPVTTSSTADGSVTSTSIPPFSTGAVGTNNVNVAFLIGFAALAIFV